METLRHQCPYCGEPIHLVVDEEMLEEQYIEDCEVCCRPMVVQLYDSNGGIEAVVKTENDT